jgi:hypothetical protein
MLVRDVRVCFFVIAHSCLRRARDEPWESRNREIRSNRPFVRVLEIVGTSVGTAVASVKYIALFQYVSYSFLVGPWAPLSTSVGAPYFFAGLARCRAPTLPCLPAEFAVSSCLVRQRASLK